MNRADRRDFWGRRRPDLTAATPRTAESDPGWYSFFTAETAEKKRFTAEIAEIAEKKERRKA
jgi:hypothetical protein